MALYVTVHSMGGYRIIPKSPHTKGVQGRRRIFFTVLGMMLYGIKRGRARALVASGLCTVNVYVRTLSTAGLSFSIQPTTENVVVNI